MEDWHDKYLPLNKKAEITRRLCITFAQLIFIGWVGLIAYGFYEFIAIARAWLT